MYVGDDKYAYLRQYYRCCRSMPFAFCQWGYFAIRRLTHTIEMIDSVLVFSKALRFITPTKKKNREENIQRNLTIKVQTQTALLLSIVHSANKAPKRNTSSIG